MLAYSRVLGASMLVLVGLVSGGCTVRSTADKQPEADHDGRADESTDPVESDGSTGAGGAPSTATGSGASSGCGDTVCDIGETCGNCPGDCGECTPGCNDGTCAADESCWSCPDDCGECCGDGACAGGSEDCATCPEDCGPCEGGDPPATGCGNGVCDTAAGETPCSCASDCPNDPNSCDACECGASGGSCYCDAACVQYGDCCADACQVCGQCGTSTASSSSSTGGGTGPYYWMTTCGDPVCGGHVWKATVPACNGVAPGQGCYQPGVTCDPVNACNSYLVCTDTDPKLYGCPKSLARFKRDISYLDDAELERIHGELVDMKLARWQYNEESIDAREHVGFIIDDAPASAAVAADGEHVDLYGYASMAAAALQVQHRRIEAMEKELATLRAEMRALREERRSR